MPNKSIRFSVFAVSLVLVLGWTAAPALAHKVYLFAWVEGDTVHTESYFSRSRKAHDSLVEVFDPDGQKLLEGRTDENGLFSFKVPQKTELKIVLNASMGHKTEYLLTAEDLGIVESQDSSAVESSASTVSPPAPAPGAVIDPEQLQSVMEKALDEKLKPVYRALAKLEEERGPGLTEIIGGIGYIFGIMGLILYFQSRKK